MKLSQRGFTLLEILIAIGIMAFITVFTVQSLQNAMTQKNRIQRNIDRIATVRDALKVMERDINLAFNYRDINIELHNQAQEERRKRHEQKQQQGDEQGRSNQGGSGRTPNQTLPNNSDETNFQLKEEQIFTHFIGYEDNMHFTTLSNVRISAALATSDQAQVGYALRNCRSRTHRDRTSNCLWRRLNPYLDDKVEEGGDEIVLLENVTEFSLRYLGEGPNEEWQREWRSNISDQNRQNRFPVAVEITVEVQNTHIENDIPTRMTMVASLRNPNNPQEREQEEVSNDGNQQPLTQ